MSFSSIVDEALAEVRAQSQKKIYRRDPEAWYADVLDGRWWSKQREIVWAFADPTRNQTMTVVKSCNGVGKTRLAADLATWMVATVDPMELSIITTAPIFAQIGTGLFRYINDNYNAASLNGFTLPGRFVADPALKVSREGGGNDKSVIQAKRPADNNLISSFQGIHDGVVAVFMDEAGGLPEDLWIGANAVTTNEYARILAIGNPDNLHTAFYQRFRDRERFKDWTPISISAYDSPNLTGEVIHPDPVKDRAIKSHLVQADWVEMMERQAHPNVVLAKVHGEFPKDDSTSFFSQHVINLAYETEIEVSPEMPLILGVDLAFGGEDDTVVYENRGGRVRKVKKLQYNDDFLALAAQVHQVAVSMGASELRIDAAGTGKGVYSILRTEPKYQGFYELIGVSGGESSPDSSQWAQFRAFMYDSFRKQMQLGEIDLDFDDVELKEQLQLQTYSMNKRGAIQITPKHEMRSKGQSSPDELDAAIMAGVDLTAWTGNPLNTLTPGDQVVVDPYELLELQFEYGSPGFPL